MSTLVELSDLNYAEALRDLARRAGGVVHDEDGLMLYTSPHRMPVLANGAFRTDGRLSGASVLERAAEFFARFRRGYTIHVRAHADADVRAAAEAAGLLPMGDPPGMVLDRRLTDAVAPAGVVLRRVETEEDAAAFGEVMGGAYATYGMPADVGPMVVGRLAVLRAPHIVAYLAFVDGQAAAGAMTIVTHGVAGIYWVGTRPFARGRGLAELVTRAAGNAGFDLGARVAALQASVMGEPVYRRMGYVEVTRYPFFVRMSAST